MELNITEIPEKWVIIQFPNNIFKVFASWSGGYLDGSRWKLNSGIVVDEISTDEEFYYFVGFSGSVYKCHKKAYGVADSFSKGILTDIVAKTGGKVLDELEWYRMGP
jgi:hypothetical protein